MMLRLYVKKRLTKSIEADVPSVQIKLYLRMRTSVRRLGAGRAVKKVPEGFVLSRCIV